MENSITIRTATEEDASALLSIYRPYVEKTAITFEYDAPSLSEFRERITHTLASYPWLVIEKEGIIKGYAYAGPFKTRKAYEHSAELSIYIDMASHHEGLGKMLYTALESLLIKQHIYNLEACIAYTEEDDPFLPKDSPLFHERLGFKRTAYFHRCAYKFDRWYHMIWMEKETGHREKVENFIPFPELMKSLEP